MKFISGIKHAKFEESGELRIKIPRYHRVCIGFLTGTSVHCIPRNYLIDKKSLTIRELIFTAITPKIWDEIRKITVNTHDDPGIINKITSRLSAYNINVHVVEDISTEIDSNHTITLIVDLSENILHKIPDIDKKNIPDIDDRIKYVISPEIYDQKIYTAITDRDKIIEIDVPKVNKLNFLFTNSKKYDTGVTHINPAIFKDKINTNTDSFDRDIKINSGSIAIDKVLGETLKLDECIQSNGKVYYTMFSDTEEKYIKILFFDPGQTVVFIDVIHLDGYGAIAKFTEIIKNAQGNIIGSYSRQQMDKKQAHWFALIDITNVSKDKDDCSIFYTEILDQIDKCRYRDKSVENIFLVEVNKINRVPDETIRKYGQNKKTEEKEYTDVFFERVKIIVNYIIENTKRNKLINDTIELLYSGITDKTFVKNLDKTYDIALIEEILSRSNLLSKLKKEGKITDDTKIISVSYEYKGKQHKVDALDNYLIKDDLMNKINPYIEGKSQIINPENISALSIENEEQETDKPNFFQRLFRIGTNSN